MQGMLEQLLRVMYISHAWTATDLQLQESQSKDGRNGGQTAKRSFWSLQCPALKCPRQAPAGQTSVFRRTLDFDQRCPSGGRPEYRRDCLSSIETEANRQRDTSRYLAASSQTHSSSRA